MYLVYLSNYEVMSEEEAEAYGSLSIYMVSEQ